MNDYEKSRWMALICAIDVIDKQCQLKNIQFNQINIKPSSLKRYINDKALEIQYNYLNTNNQPTKINSQFTQTEQHSKELVNN